MTVREGAIARLHPSIRYVLATNLGWRELRPIQETAIEPILAGATTLIVAPTAGGKTEAAVLPLFSRALDERWSPTSVLYLAPLRALLNDLGERLGQLGDYLGLNVAVWHGDVGQSERRRIESSPPDLLLTTPESLEVLLSLASEERRALLAGLRAVVVDEAHAFYGIDRGTQLLSLLERLQLWAQRDIQRIGLSATIGNPEQLVAWFRGSSGRPTALVRVPHSAERLEAFEVSYRPGLAGIIADITRYENEKVIAFCRTRSDVEELAHGLDASGITAWAHHSALSKANREDAEREFREAARGVLVATSTLELGIDIGDLDRIVQVDAPTTVASLLQRLGRTGRRGGPARMTFIARNAEQLALVAALLALHAKAWIEPLVPPWRPFPVLVQQLLATVVQTGGISRAEIASQCAHNAAFARITPEEVDALVTHLLAEDILATLDGSVTLGIAGERLFGFRNFMELASVFAGTESVTVMNGEREVGTLDRWFIDEMLARDRSSFLLNGRAWNVARWPEADSLLEVVPGSSADAPLFLGGGLVLSYAVMQSVRAVLADPHPLETLAPAQTVVMPEATRALAELRELSATQRLDLPSSPLVTEGGLSILYTYAGLRANRLIADAVFEPLGLPTTATNTAIKVRTNTFDIASVKARLALLLSEDIDLLLSGRTARPVRAVKFADVLGPFELQSFQRERMYEIEGARSVAAASIRVLSRASA